MKKILILFMGLAVTLISIEANAAMSLWPLEVGQIWIYQDADTLNNSSIMQFTVDSVISLDSSFFGIAKQEDYFHIVESDMSETFARATDEAIYGWSNGDAFMLKIGMDWAGPAGLIRYLGTQEVTVPYGGPYTAHVWGGDDVPGFFEYDFFVPGVGYVQSITHAVNSKLVDIVSTPIPGAIWLLSFGFAGLVVVRNRLK